MLQTSVVLVTLLITALASSGEAKAPADNIQDKIYGPFKTYGPYIVVARNTLGTECSCVKFARAFSGIQVFGDADTLSGNTNFPEVGAWVLTTESPMHHVAVITGIDGDELILTEANYVECKITQGRKLRIDSPLIKGYVTALSI